MAGYATDECVVHALVNRAFAGGELVLVSLVLLQESVLDTWTAVAAKGSKLGMWISNAVRYPGHRFKRRQQAASL